MAHASAGQRAGPSAFAPGHALGLRRGGRGLRIYLDPHTEALMTGKLEEGKSYVFIAREASLSHNPEDTLSFDLLSYDLAAR